MENLRIKLADLTKLLSRIDGRTDPETPITITVDSSTVKIVKEAEGKQGNQLLAYLTKSK